MKTHNFKRALQFVLTAEGVGSNPDNPHAYTNDPDDRGGETKFGISKRSYPHLKIKDLTLAQAEDIYHQDYWRRCNCDELPPDIAIAVFDCAVNQGVYNAATFLQRLVDATPDALIGPKTLEAVSRYSRGYLLISYLGCRAEHYHDLVVDDASQARFLRGWFRRLFGVMAYIREVA